MMTYEVRRVPHSIIPGKPHYVARVCVVCNRVFCLAHHNRIKITLIEPNVRYICSRACAWESYFKK